MSCLSYQHESNRSVENIPSRSMSREENIEFDEKLNSRIFDNSTCSSVSRESESDIDSPPPPPPPLDDDLECSDCGNETSRCSDINVHFYGDRVTICRSLCRSSTTVGTNDNQNNDVARDDGESDNEGNSHCCSVKWEHGDCIQTRFSTSLRSTCNHSTTDGNTINRQIVGREIDDEIDENCDHCSVECEHEDCSVPTSCRSICKISAADGGNDIRQTAVDCEDGDDDGNDKNIDASNVGWGHGEHGHTNNVENIEVGKCEVSSLIETYNHRFGGSSTTLERKPPAVMHHRSNNSSFFQLSMRLMHHNTQSTLAPALIDPPTSDEDENARGSYLGHHKSVMNYTFRACFFILKKFALRCAFDHWRRKTNNEQNPYSASESTSLEPCDNLGIPSFLSSNRSISSSIHSPDAFSITSLRSLRRRPLLSCHVSLPVQIQLSHSDGTTR